MKTIIIIVVLTLIGLIGYSYVEEMKVGSSTTSQVEDSSSTFTISVSGEVKKTGTFVFKEGATMLDLLEAAGGATTNADPRAYDTSFVLRKSDKAYYIAPIFDNANTCASDPIEKANINTDDAETIHDITGMSSSVAHSLVTYRSTNPFFALEQIKDVPGIGPATFLTVKDKIILREAQE